MLSRGFTFVTQSPIKRGLCRTLALGGAFLAVAGIAVGCGSQSPHQDALSYVKEHGQDAHRVQAIVQVVQVSVALVQKSPTEAKVSELAQYAQKAHDRLDELREAFLSGVGKYDETIDHVANMVYESTNNLKNAMGALVAYTGSPNPATLAHFTTQYEQAAAEWNEGIKTIWRLAHTSNPPTV